MLELKNVDAGYGKKMVLSDVSVKLNDNTITVVMGPNGAGKSTLLKTAYGLIKTSSGEILFNGEKIIPTPQKLVELGVFMVPQGKRVFTNMTVMENLELATHFWKERSQFAERLDEVLAHFPDLKSRLTDLAGNLSGGQQQMVALARGLINKPKMVFMDEPSIGLSPKLINDTFHKIKEIKDNMGTAFVIVEHNLKTLLPLTDWAYILDQGKVIYDGKSEGKTLEKMVSAVFK
ncbi:MAG: ABC transporter ATP-binding protein [Alphaproteobacteria bacterium]|nr:ABC transporter ATP-binding protein [Alphaproteobacteria bacterium]